MGFGLAAAVISRPYSVARTRPAWIQITGLWFLQIVILSGVMLGAASLTVTLGLWDGPLPASRPIDGFPYVWARYDSGYYLRIAIDGYDASTLAFFPLYPVLMHALGSLLGGHVYLAGYLISAASWLCALHVFYRTALLLRDDSVFAMRATLFFALFPTAFFFQAIYAEGLFIALVVAATFFILQRQWVAAGVFIGLATITRPIGWLWGVMLLVEFINVGDFSPKTLGQLVLAGIIALSGIFAYVLVTASATGTPQAILISLASWKRSWTLPPISLIEGTVNLFHLNTLRDNWFLFATNVYDTFFTLVGVALAALSHRILRRWSITILLIVGFLFLLASKGPSPEIPLWGMARWVPQLFPIFFVLGALKMSPLVRRGIGVGSALWLLAFAAWWATGRWVA